MKISKSSSFHVKTSIYLALETLTTVIDKFSSPTYMQLCKIMINWFVQFTEMDTKSSADSYHQTGGWFLHIWWWHKFCVRPLLRVQLDCENCLGFLEHFQCIAEEPGDASNKIQSNDAEIPGPGRTLSLWIYNLTPFFEN